MLDSLSGQLFEKDNDYAIVDVNGLRFRCEIPTSTYESLPKLGKAAELFTRMSLSVNDGTFQLFGFGSKVERECFDIFTSINGIGPRKGLMILSQIEIASFARAIVANDLTYLSKIKGIGKKTAERLVVELREKMSPYTQGGTSVPVEGSVELPEGQAIRDAVEALVVLGCKLAVAERAIAEAVKEVGEDASTEQIVRAGLRYR